MPSISKRPSNFVYYICCRWDKVESTDSLMSQWNLKIKDNNSVSQTAAHMCVCACLWGSVHTQKLQQNPVFFFLSSFSLTMLGLFTRACYITSVPWQREMDCVGRGWRFGEYIIFVFCVGLCASEDTLCICLMYDGARSCFVERAADMQM